MKLYFTKSLWLLGFTMLICCGIYPLAVLTIGQVVFPFQANGSVLFNNQQQAVGSQWIAEAFTQPQYFHPRPSAANFNAELSASSALAASNPTLRKRLTQTLAQLAQEGIYTEHAPIPADAVMSSASGLDPHITLAYAERQLSRVAAAWAGRLHRNTQTLTEEIDAMLQKNAFSPLGISGESKIINMMTLNWMLMTTYMESAHD